MPSVFLNDRSGTIGSSKLICLIMLGLVAGRPAWADGIVDKRWQLTVGPQFGLFRGQAPLPVTVTLNWGGDELMEGRLRLKWYVRQTLLGTYVSPETALAGSSITRQVLLPPVIMPDDDAVFSVQGEFVTDSRVYDLDIHDLAVPLDWRRTFVVGVCRTAPLRMEATTVTGQSGLIESVRLEPFFGEPFRGGELSTMVVEIDPDDISTNPLQLMGFDILVIPGESFGQLTERCLEGLTTWVEAGGSLCVLVDSPMPARHVDFLNRLSGGRSADAAYRRSDAGALVPVAGEAVGIDRFRPALGRLVIARGTVDYDGQDWQDSLLFLWKVRRSHIDGWLQGTPLQVDTRRDQDNYLQLLTLEPLRSKSWPSLSTLLLPESIRGLPLLTVTAILVVFLIVIAPGDYLLLGWVRRRRWTWVLFPAMSLLFTWLTMWLAERQLGIESLGRSITIVDLSSDGRPVRTSRFDLLFTAHSHAHVDELQQSLMVPIDAETGDTTASRVGLANEPVYEPPWTYEGNLPGRHVVRRDVQQWSPRLSRTTTLGVSDRAPESPLAEFAWGSIAWKQLDEPTGVEQLRQALHSADPSAKLVVLGTSPNGESRVTAPQNSQIFNLVTLISTQANSPLFSLISQVSPTAAGNWEDLALLDPSDDQRLILAMVEPSEGEYVVYRQLLTKEE